MSNSPRQTERSTSECSALLVRVAAGDRVAFGELHRAFGPRVKGYLMRWCSDASEAEALTQDVFLKVWRRAATFDAARGSAETWLFTLARHRGIDAIRKERMPHPDPDDPNWVPRAPIAADEAVGHQWQAARIAEALKELPESQCEVLTQAFFEYRTYSEIAAGEGVPLGTVKSRVRLAFQRLREILDGQER